MVVAIGHDREVPSSVSIYAGGLSHFPIVFNLVDYVSTTSEYSSSVEGVTIALDPEYDNILTVSVAESVTAGTVANIKFRNQVIMHVTAVAPAKNIPIMTMPEDSNETGWVETTGLTISEPAYMDCKVNYNGIVKDVHIIYYRVEDMYLGKVDINDFPWITFKVNGNKLLMKACDDQGDNIEGLMNGDATIEVTEIKQGDVVIYP